MPSLTGSADFSTGPSGGAGCVDPWHGQGVASVAGYNSLKTVGTDACGGCMVPVCLMLNLVRIAQPPGTPGGDIEVSNPLVSNYVTWQGASLFLCLTPTVNRTWGQVKSLYR